MLKRNLSDDEEFFSLGAAEGARIHAFQRFERVSANQAYPVLPGQGTGISAFQGLQGDGIKIGMFFFRFRGPREGTDGGFLPFFFRHSDEFRIHAFKFMGFPGNGGFQVFGGGSYMDLDIDGLHCCSQLFQNLVVVGGVGQVWGAVLAALGLGISGTVLEIGLGAVLAKIILLVLVILFIQKRPQGLFAIKGRFVE